MKKKNRESFRKVEKRIETKKKEAYTNSKIRYLSGKIKCNVDYGNKILFSKNNV